MDKIIYGDFITDCFKHVKMNSVDVVVTDPPYFILNEKWDKGDFEQFTEEWLNNCYMCLKPGGTIWSFMAYERHYEFNNIMSKYFKRNLDNDVVWVRAKGRSSAKHLKSLREDIFYGYKEDGEPVWNPLKMIREVIAPYMENGRPRGWFVDETGKRVRFTGLGNVWTYSQAVFSSTVEPPIHPTQKPVMMLERLIRLSSNEGDVVLDPFIGSGSTAIACLLSKRKYIGFEKTEKYYNYAVKRVSEFNIDDYLGYNKTNDINIIKKGLKINDNIPKELVKKYNV